MTPVQRLLAWHARRYPDTRLAEQLANLLEGIHGRVVEVGCGDGSLFPLYPGTVTELIGIEPDAEARAAAERRALLLAINASVEPVEDGRIPLPDDSADFAVCCEVLCSASDGISVLLEIRRILRPGGVVCVFEHVRSERLGMRIVQRVADSIGWPLLLGGCHTARDSVALIESAGFTWVELRRVSYLRMPLLFPTAPHIIGWARAGRRT